MQDEDLVQNYLRDPDGQVQIRNVESSAYSCYAKYTNGHSVGMNAATNEYLVPDSGVILGTGHLLDFDDNNSDKTSTNLREDTGEPDLESQLPNGAKVFDHCYIQFEFQCPPESESFIPKVNLDYVFGSEEHFKEDHNNDAFGAFLNGKNIALVPDGNDGSPITVNNINSDANSGYFIGNKLSGRSYLTSQYSDIEPDGLTTKLQASATGLPGWNTMKLVVGDVGDGELDSWVLLNEGVVSCAENKPTTSPTFRADLGIDLKEKVRPTTPNQEDVTSLYKSIPMEIAVGLAVLLGILALALPVIGLVFCNDRNDADSS